MPESHAENLPVTQRGRATRDRIVGAAAEVLMTEGLTGFSIDQVRQIASVSGSQLSHYFADKDALMHAVIARQIEILLDFHRQPALGDLDTFDDYEQWVELTMQFSRRKLRAQPVPTFGALAGQLSKHDQHTRELLATGYQRWSAIFRRGLTRMKRNGLLVDSANPAALANVLMSAHEGATLLSSAYGATWPDHDALTFALTYLRQFTAHQGDQLSDSTPSTTKGGRARAGAGR
ncbi:MAG TPA: TetR/AcrR family transcriptional regulator [Mycobacterium sp.]|jgi:AcrR family transcriptional regulator|nr:TetR/AcrR family transcriptional regulator [Mycobacterium sp.]